jgi:hypothetical protein
VSGEVEQRQVVAPGVAVEVGDRLPDDVVWLIDQHGDVEVRDLRVLQHGRKGLRVALRRREPAQPCVRVLVRGDDQSLAPGGHAVTSAGAVGRRSR